MSRRASGRARSNPISQGACPSPSNVRVMSAASTLAECCTAAARPELAQQLQQQFGDVGRWKTNSQLPIVYHPNYNISFLGLEKLHPFDSCKFRKVVAGLKTNGVIESTEQLVQPSEVSQEDLLKVHTQEYLHALNSSSVKVAKVTELIPLAILPHCLVERLVLKPMRTHVGGTVLATALAVAHGWAVNIGGGMHHAHREDGSGWCAYADITLAIHRIREASAGAVQRVIYIDLDVHQGNGVERDKLYYKDKDLYIVDMYNSEAFPWDTKAMKAINVKVPLSPGTSDEIYLSELDGALNTAAKKFPDPQLVVYNAGTDILTGDPLGRFEVSPAAVIQRDAAVFGFADRLKAPIVVLLSGGYTTASAGVIVDSLTSLLMGVAAKLQASAPAEARKEA